jgi:aminoglycoside phosphotransferase (APT) family kinase protein
MALLITAVLASVAAVALVLVAKRRVNRMRQMKRFEAQWRIVRKLSESDDPLVRRAAAKQALRLIRRGPN